VDLPWPAIIGVVSVITMTLGNITAMVQTNLKRLLAYSSIAHAGYTLMGLTAVSANGMQSIMIYMLVYLVMNLGAFLVVILVAQSTGSESIFEYRGLGKRQPLAAITFALFLFSLTGLPPLAGFTGKWFIFNAVLQRAGGPGGSWYVVLAIIGALNTAVSLYYYARIIRAMFLESPFTAEPVKSPMTYTVMLSTFAAALLVFGIWWQPLIEWTAQSLVMLRG
jgi:NADH-quinone oxidoreductase subunit N